MTQAQRTLFREACNDAALATYCKRVARGKQAGSTDQQVVGAALLAREAE
jgi:hypothetical protein